jgi:hypothetical protein
MAEHETQRSSEDGEDQEVGSAAPKDAQRVVGENADVPAGEGEEADEAGVEGGSGSEASGDGASSAGKDAERDAGDGERDDRDELAREIEADPASNPDDPALREIKGG